MVKTESKFLCSSNDGDSIHVEVLNSDLLGIVIKDSYNNLHKITLDKNTTIEFIDYMKYKVSKMK
jgi:hypothetical protein